MVVLLTCKNVDPIKTEAAIVLTTFLPLNYESMGFFSDAQGQLTKLNQSLVESGQIPNSSEIFHCPGKNEEDPIKREGAGVLKIFFTMLTLWVAMETRVLIT